MKTLILHHVESCWDEALQRVGNKTIEQVIDDIADHFEETSYDRVILTRFEDWELEHVHAPIAHHIDTVEPYAYGWSADMFDDESRYCEGGNHSEVVEIADWMHDLVDDDVYIAGAFDGECIEDLEIALSHLQCDYHRVDHLIV